MKSNLSILAEKLMNGRWLLKAGVHAQLCKQVEGYMNNPKSFASDLVPPTQYVESEDPSESHAIVYLHGIVSKNVSEEAEQCLGLTDIDWFTNSLNLMANDPTVKDIIVCFASPGGETTGVEEAGRLIREIDENIKPVYCWCENQSDSAAYWLMSQGRTLGMTPSAQVGGCGVYMLVLDATRQMEKEGLSVDAIYSGKFKMLGHEFRSLTKQERQILQDDVDNQHKKFKQTILARRPDVSEEDLEGLSFNGEQALSKHLVDVLADDIGTFISMIEKEETNMKPQVTKVQVAQAASTEVQKKEETKVEVATTATTTEVKKLSFLDRVKQLMGEYDGSWSAVPGVPGTEEAPHVEPDGDEPKDDDTEECTQCKGTGRCKKASEPEKEPEVKAEEPKEEPKAEDPKPEAKAEEAKPEVVAETPNRMPTVEEFRKMQGIAHVNKSKAQSDWDSLCNEFVKTNQTLS